MAQAPQEEPKIPKETTGKRIAEKYSDMMKVLNEEETIKKGKNYLEENVIESTVGILLIIGFVLSFFFPLYGGTAVAFFSGLVLSVEFVRVLGKCYNYIKKGNGFKSFAAIMLGITLFVIVPIQSVGFCIGFLLRWLIQPKLHHFKEE